MNLFTTARLCLPFLRIIFSPHSSASSSLTQTLLFLHDACGHLSSPNLLSLARLTPHPVRLTSAFPLMVSSLILFFLISTKREVLHLLPPFFSTSLMSLSVNRTTVISPITFPSIPADIHSPPLMAPNPTNVPSNSQNSSLRTTSAGSLQANQPDSNRLTSVKPLSSEGDGPDAGGQKPEMGSGLSVSSWKIAVMRNKALKETREAQG